MDPLEELRAKIAEFPGYDGDIERRHSDQYVRSYLGEALAALEARVSLDDGLRTKIEDLTLRVGFADTRAFPAHPSAHPSDAGIGAVAQADLATISLADRAKSLDAPAVGAYLDEVAAELDVRDAAIRAASAMTT
jgi:hypothetical protein